MLTIIVAALPQNSNRFCPAANAMHFQLVQSALSMAPVLLTHHAHVF